MKNEKSCEVAAIQLLDSENSVFVNDYDGTTKLFVGFSEVSVFVKKTIKQFQTRDNSQNKGAILILGSRRSGKSLIARFLPYHMSNHYSIHGNIMCL